MSDTVIIVQARMTSTRLPGKVLLPIDGRPLLDYMIERLRRVSSADQIIVATTVNAADDPIVAFCADRHLECFRGSETDVLSRYFEAARKFSAGTIVRVTSDCPLIDPEVTDSVIRFYRENRHQYDYVSNTLQRTYPQGLDTEVFSFAMLEQAQREAKEGREREHVTPFFYLKPDRFRLGHVKGRVDLSHHRWTVDTAEDFDLVGRLICACLAIRQDFGYRDVLRQFELHPDWFGINRHIRQKSL